jgi:hypothetical protein
MSALKSAIAIAVVLPLGACGYDYLQHTDRVAFSAGDAVKANIESETTDPSRHSLYNTKGLGKNGDVIPAPNSTTSASSGTPASN